MKDGIVPKPSPTEFRGDAVGIVGNPEPGVAAEHVAKLRCSTDDVAEVAQARRGRRRFEAWPDAQRESREQLRVAIVTWTLEASRPSAQRRSGMKL